MSHRVKCEHCGHIQKTNSNLNRITCSSCGKKTPNGEETPIGGNRTANTKQ